MARQGVDPYAVNNRLLHARMNFSESGASQFIVINNQLHSL